METGDVSGFPGTDEIVTFRCSSAGGDMAAYIDGIKVYQGRVWHMQLDIQMPDVRAVEVYPRLSTLPIEYSGLGVCAVILIWTG